jgi:hypothetical protein
MTRVRLVPWNFSPLAGRRLKRYRDSGGSICPFGYPEGVGERSEPVRTAQQMDAARKGGALYGAQGREPRSWAMVADIVTALHKTAQHHHRRRGLRS